MSVRRRVLRLGLVWIDLQGIADLSHIFCLTLPESPTGARGRPIDHFLRISDAQPEKRSPVPAAPCA